MAQSTRTTTSANVQYGETGRDGICDLHRLPLRQIGEDHPHGGLLQNGKNISDVSRLSLTGNSDSLARTLHTETFLACGLRV